MRVTADGVYRQARSNAREHSIRAGAPTRRRSRAVTRKTIVITRADLYAQVWAVPTRGYWARGQAGHSVRVEPLPAPIRGQEMEHRFERWMTPEAEYLLRDEFQAEIKDALTKADGVERNEDLQGAHGLVAESLPLLGVIRLSRL